MPWPSIVALLIITTSCFCINRPVYKIFLTQKGFSQFIQYDIDTPPIREFTFCTWFRIYDLDNEQGLFSYVVNGNRVIRLWLDTGGNFMKVAINEKPPSMFAVDITRDVWRHICLSYQSDYGAWALYMDGKLVTCETIQSLHGFVLPQGGSVIIGYGTSNVIPSGLEGEVFGVNMILTSTIERNHTLKRDPLYEQKRFIRNRVIGNKNLKYIVLGQMNSNDIQNNFETTKMPLALRTNKIYIGLTPPYSITEREIQSEDTSSNPKMFYEFNEKENFDYSITDITGTTDKTKINFWSLVNQAGKERKFKGQDKNSLEQTVYRNQGSPTVSVWATPPPTESKSFYSKSVKPKKPTFPSLYELNEEFNDVNKTISTKPNKEIVSERGTSSPSEKDRNVYGQWTSSKFAGSVLNYLKRINFYNREHVKVPSNIPLVKISESFPYPTEFKGSKVHQPLKFQRRNFVDKHFDKRDVNKRQAIKQLPLNDFQDQISNCHILTQPRCGDITQASHISTTKKNHRFYRNAESKLSSEYELSADMFRSKPLAMFSDSKFTKNPLNSEGQKSNNLLTILPFIKSIEYFVDNNNNSSNEIFNESDLYTRSLLQGNKWHNVQTYSNDFTPRRLNMETDGIQKNTDVSEANKKLPSVRLKYKPTYRNFMANYKDATIIEGRALAKEVSNQSTKHDSISIQKYNRGFLPKHRTDRKSSDKVNEVSRKNHKQSFLNIKDNFHTDIKIGEGLNQRRPIGFNAEQSKKSLMRGNNKVTNINRHKSRISEKISQSLGPKVCKSLELYDHILHVQPDGSVDLTPIVSPVKDLNIGIEFIMQNYKRCSLKDSNLEKNSLLFIDWNKTPVRLFGGAYPKKTTDLCGFF